MALAQSQPPSNKLLPQKRPKKRCCYYYRVKLCLLATFRLDPPPTVLGRQNLERKTQDFFCKKNLNLGHAATKGSVRVRLFEEVLDQRGGALRSHKVVSTIAVSVAFHLVTSNKKCWQYIGRKKKRNIGTRLRSTGWSSPAERRAWY